MFNKIDFDKFNKSHGLKISHYLNKFHKFDIIIQFNQFYLFN